MDLQHPCRVLSSPSVGLFLDVRIGMFTGIYKIKRKELIKWDGRKIQCAIGGRVWKLWRLRGKDPINKLRFSSKLYHWFDRTSHHPFNQSDEKPEPLDFSAFPRRMRITCVPLSSLGPMWLALQLHWFGLTTLDWEPLSNHCYYYFPFQVRSKEE